MVHRIEKTPSTRPLCELYAQNKGCQDNKKSLTVIYGILGPALLPSESQKGKHPTEPATL